MYLTKDKNYIILCIQKSNKLREQVVKLLKKGILEAIKSLHAFVDQNHMNPALTDREQLMFDMYR